MSLSKSKSNKSVKKKSSFNDSEETISNKVIIDTLTKFALKEDIKITVKYSASTTAICGTSSFIGALAFSPFGLIPVGTFVGSVIGSVTSYVLFKEKYKSLATIIDELPDGEKSLLSKVVREAVKKSIGPTTEVFKLINDKDKSYETIINFVLKNIKKYLEENGLDASVLKMCDMLSLLHLVPSGDQVESNQIKN